MNFKKTLLSIFSSVLVINAYAKDKSAWAEVRINEKETYFSDKYWKPKQYKQFVLDTTSLYNKLSETSINGNKTILTLPTPDGNFTEYSIEEVSVMAAGLAKKHPSIKTYRGTNINNANEHIRISKTELGFNAYVFGKETYYITTINQNKEQYIVYNKKDIELVGNKMHCENGELSQEIEQQDFDEKPSTQKNIGTQLRTYRLAMACSKQYTNFHGGTVSGALSAIVTTVNRVVGIYERDLDISLTLIDDTDLLICTNSSTFIYTNSDGSAMLDENQTRVDAIIGSANYDIGHVFSTGGGGVAIKAVCQSWAKAMGVTGSSSPENDPFDIDYVAHEMGHQYGADHTFNADSFTSGSCEGNRVSNSAYEPGGGTTILAYAGICGTTNNIQQSSDAYFHTRSFDQIQNYIVSTTTINNCPVKTQTGNTIPEITTSATTYTIPTGAKFRLTCSASDADEDALTFCWEEMDLGAACDWNVPTGSAPRFRSFNPTADSVRYFPKNLLTGVTVKGEIIPPTSSTLKFRCTVRDNKVGGGGVIYSPNVTVKTVTTTGVFSVTSQATTGIVYDGGSEITVDWNIANTDVAPINADNVDVFLSVDGGVTFPYKIAEAIANTGTGTATLPFDVGTTQARLIVQGSNNVFFDVNDKNFEITEVPSSIKEEKQLTNALNLYPNPNEGDFTIELAQEIGKKATISITDILGKEVVKNTVKIEKSMALNISNLNKGIYTLKIETDKQTFTKKVILQ
ncbi:MAG: zinc-dependent metalloprotease [Bacteroidota bacterium]